MNQSATHIVFFQATLTAKALAVAIQVTKGIETILIFHS